MGLSSTQNGPVSLEDNHSVTQETTKCQIEQTRWRLSKTNRVGAGTKLDMIKRNVRQGSYRFNLFSAHLRRVNKGKWPLHSTLTPTIETLKILTVTLCPKTTLNKMTIIFLLRSSYTKNFTIRNFFRKNVNVVRIYFHLY